MSQSRSASRRDSHDAPASDPDLLRRWHEQRCNASFDELSARLTPPLVTAARATRAEDPEGVAQEALTRLTERVGDLLASNANSGPDWVRSWAVRVGVNEAIDQRRKRRPSTANQEVLAAHPDRSDTPALDELIRAEEVDALAACLQALPEPLRQYVLLHFGNEMTQKQIGVLFNVSQGAVSQRLKTGRARLTACMDRKFPTHS
ncbi:MAG: sigma-70 family RNA polymerase sigma factor [Planctomycetes bacterium]|nr:sigma-70 family RNA polymerase sigma factor [Planctomycetota bacterium]